MPERQGRMPDGPASEGRMHAMRSRIKLETEMIEQGLSPTPLTTKG
jgi:hypothetical protein